MGEAAGDGVLVPCREGVAGGQMLIQSPWSLGKPLGLLKSEFLQNWVHITFPMRFLWKLKQSR